jgi:two-component system, NtrC family, response regulator HydG
MALILLVDDSLDNLICLEEFLSKLNHACRLATSGQMAMKLMDQEHFDLIISDYEMEDGDGLWLLQELKKNHQSPKCIIVTGNTEHSSAFFMQLGAAAYCLRPFHFKDFQHILDTFLR